MFRTRVSCVATSGDYFQTVQSILVLFMSSNLRFFQIDLSQRGLQPTDARLVKMALLQNAHVLVLKLGYNNLGDRGATILADGIAKHPALESLDLGFNDVGDEGCQALATAIGPNVHTLYLAGNLIGQDGAFALGDLVRRTGALKKLYVTGNKLSGEGVASITDAMLDIESDSCNPEEEKKIASYAEERACSSQSNCTTRGTEELFIGGTNMGKTGCHAVGRLLANSSYLRVLSLTGCDFGDKSTAILASSIKSNRNNFILETLQLSFNRVSCKGMEQLSNAIWGLHSLKELRLDNNRIGEHGAQHLAGVLTTLRSLETLDIGFNAIQTRGIILLMKSVTDSTRMKNLSISGNKVDVNASKALTYALAHSPSLESLSVERCDIRPDCQRQIITGIISNSRTAIRSIAGFAVGPVITSLGFPAPIEHWSNEQVFNFIQLIWSTTQGDDEEEKTTDPLNFLDSDGSNKPAPLEVSIVVELAKKTFSFLIEEGVDVFSKPSPPKQTNSPLVGDTIMLESVDLLLHEVPGKFCQDIPWSGKNKSFVAAPEASNSQQSPPDPARKKRIVEWLCHNMPRLNKISQQPFSSSELARLHQYYFAPVVNESGGGTPSPTPEAVTGNATMSVSVPGLKSTENKEGLPSSDSNLLTVCDKDSPQNGITSMPTLMKRKVSYRFLGDAALASAPRLESEGISTSRNTPTDSIKNNTNSVTMLIEKGPTMHSLPRKSKRARRNRSRISFLPKIKVKLESYLDLCHEKALKTMRQLYFVEQAILSGQVNPIDPTKTARTHLCGDFAMDAETIIVDMI